MEAERKPGRRRSRVPTEEQQEEFLRLLREGQDRAVSARAAGSTASRFRSLAYRDPRFDGLVVEAELEGRGAYVDKLREEGRARAFNRRDPASQHFLTREADAWLPEFEHKRTTRVGNAPGESLEIGATPRITAEALEAMTDSQVALAIRSAEMLREIERHGRSSIGLDFELSAD